MEKLRIEAHELVDDFKFLFGYHSILLFSLAQECYYFLIL